METIKPRAQALHQTMSGRKGGAMKDKRRENRGSSKAKLRKGEF